MTHNGARCRDTQCANSLRADRIARFYGELCDRCEREAEREDEENPRCPVCEVRKDDHDDVYPCRIDRQD